MKPAGLRTTVAYHARALWRCLLAWWFGVLADVEEWWHDHVVDEVEPRPGVVFGVPWAASDRPWYRDGQADVLVDVLSGDPDHRGEGFERDLVDVYLGVIHRKAPEEVRSWKS